MADKPHITIRRNEESFEVRVFFYFTEDPSRRAITKRMTPEQAEEAAKELARKLRDG